MFQSTLPAWGATVALQNFLMCLTVSIHAPRVGSDLRNGHLASVPALFQSTLPAWGATGVTGDFNYARIGFQSTLPAWGATIERNGHTATWQFQSTLPAWGATQCSYCLAGNDPVSIHAPRVGSDWVKGL